MNLAVIVVTYNNPKSELDNLKKSLLENGVEEKDIYFSNNAKKNVGYGGGINRVLKKILKDYEAFFILNPDVVVHKNCIQQLVKTLESDKSIGIVGPKILDSKGKIWSMGGKLDKKRYSGGLIGFGRSNDPSTSLRVKKVDFISGTAMLIRKEAIVEIGRFSLDYFLYYEDVDFCLRAIKHGYKLVVNPQAVITHHASSTVKKNSPIMRYYMARNHMWTVEKYGPLQVKLHELLRLPKTIWKARDRKYERMGLRDYFLRKKGRNDYWG